MINNKTRDYLFDKIREEAVAFSIAAIDEKIIDDINIRNATFKAMNNAVDGLSQKPDYVLIDGNAISGMTIPHECVIKGDFKCNCIGAASILAKVARDRYMLEMAKVFPQYLFEQHKGYGTKQHMDAIRNYGPLPIHRKTFIKNIVG